MKNLLGVVLALACAASLAQTPAPAQCLRGSAQSFDGKTFVINERSGQPYTLVLAELFSISGLVQIEPS